MSLRCQMISSGGCYTYCQILTLDFECLSLLSCVLNVSVRCVYFHVCSQHIAYNPIAAYARSSALHLAHKV